MSEKMDTKAVLDWAGVVLARLNLEHEAVISAAGSFRTALLEALARADIDNTSRIARGFPELAMLWGVYKMNGEEGLLELLDLCNEGELR